MTAFAERIFADALLDPEQPIPAAAMAHHAQLPIKRFAVYRNNVMVGLVNALRNRFPVVTAIVGGEFFNAMARLYVEAQPPRSKVLAEYGDSFGDFIAAFPPAQDLPYLPDIAQLEAARTHAYHAADADPIGADRFADVPPEFVAALRVTLHPSLQIIRSRYPLVTIWAMNAGEHPLGPVDMAIAQDAMIARPSHTVLVTALPPGGAAFLSALQNGDLLHAAAHAAMQDDAAFDLAANLAGLIGCGLIIDFTIGDHQS